MTTDLEGRCSIQLSYGQKHLWRTAWRQVQKKPNEWAFLNFGRSTRIRTLDPLVPNQVRYQTAPHSETEIIARRQFDFARGT